MMTLEKLEYMSRKADERIDQLKDDVAFLEMLKNDPMMLLNLQGEPLKRLNAMLEERR